MMAFESRVVPCRDVISRSRNSTVAVKGAEVVQTVPAGEIARYNTHQLSALIEALTAARDELFRREA